MNRLSHAQHVLECNCTFSAEFLSPSLLNHNHHRYSSLICSTGQKSPKFISYPSPTMDPACGHHLIPHLIDQFAHDTPNRTYCSLPTSSNIEDGYRYKDISYSRLANAINHAAQWIQHHLGRSSEDYPTMAYLGPSDLRYIILTIAAQKTGYKVVLAFPVDDLWLTHSRPSSHPLEMTSVQICIS